MNGRPPDVAWGEEEGDNLLRSFATLSVIVPCLNEERSLRELGVLRARGEWIGVLDADLQYQLDERLAHMPARRRGLRVLFIDPESYFAPDGGTLAYPVEAPQRDDLFVRATADAAMAALCPRLVSAAGRQIT